MNNQNKLVAVYGSLRKGLHNHCILEDGIYKGIYTLPSGIYSMYSLGSFPYITEDTNGTRIVLEVYQVNPSTASDLDMLEGYPSFYQKASVKTPFGIAELYHIEDARKKGYDMDYKVPNGDWKDYKETNLVLREVS